MIFESDIYMKGLLILTIEIIRVSASIDSIHDLEMLEGWWPAATWMDFVDE